MARTYNFFIHGLHPSEAKGRSIQWEDEALLPVGYETRSVDRGSMDLEISVYTQDKAMEVTDVFHEAVHSIPSSIYTEEQKEAWAPTPPDYFEWSQRLKENMVFITTIDENIAGFIELESGGHIYAIFTRPRYQNCGVGDVMLDYILNVAKSIGLRKVTADVSKVAKEFFEHRGFEVVKENAVEKNGQTLVNYSMEKDLS